jgi:photosystem II stability/assembly factor-like uncharacterized protein
MAGDNGGLFKSENGGGSWFSVSSNLGAYRLGFVTLDPLNPEVIYVAASTDYGIILSGGETGEIHRSLDGGLSWEFVVDGMGFQNSFPNQRAIVIPYDSSNSGRFDGDGDGVSDVIVVGAWTGPANPPVGGIWRSEDEGGTFTHQALQNRNITALRAFPNDANVLFATTYEGEVYRSGDMGEQWAEITGNMPLNHVSDVAVHPTNQEVVYVTCRWCQAGVAPVWKTEDGGQSWQGMGSGLDTGQIDGFPKLLIDRFDAETVYIGSNKAPYGQGGVYRSTDGGNSWQLMSSRLVLPDGRPYFWYEFDNVLTLEQAIDGRLFASDSRGGWRYPAGDGQEEWEPATIGVGNIHVHAIEVDPSDPGVLYQGIADFGPYKSIDEGESFHRVLGSGWPVEVGNYGWSGPYYRNYVECSLSCSTTCTGSEGLGAGGTTDFVISHQDPNIVYSAFGGGSGTSAKGGVNKSVDGGATWQPVGFQMEEGFELNPDGCVPYGFQHLAIDPTNDQNVFAVQEITTSNTKLYKTSDGGATWDEVFAASSPVRGMEVSVHNPDVVVVAADAGVYKSEEGGAAGSWQAINPAGTGGKTIALSPHDADVYVIGTNDLGLYYTSDGGASWHNNRLEGFFEQRVSQGSSEYLGAELATGFNPEEYVLRNISAIVFDPVRPDTFYVAGTQYRRASFGVAKITNAGQNWERLPLSGLSHRNVFDLAIDSVGEYLYAGTFNGTYRLKLR